MSHFNVQQKVLFQHCDPAGIVFYPRYFEMINAAVETWFEDGLGVSFAQLLGARGSGAPTVTINTSFQNPSHLGDLLAIDITVLKIGGASLDLEICAQSGGTKRFESTLTLVHINKETGRPNPWPDDLRDAINLLLKEAS
ncbi:MAG: acyl-CoA thioesterase [Sneathiella sp.]|nr:acyl-CoA thioesterase [Sneathiella sp.]